MCTGRQATASCYVCPGTELQKTGEVNHTDVGDESAETEAADIAETVAAKSADTEAYTITEEHMHVDTPCTVGDVSNKLDIQYYT